MNNADMNEFTDVMVIDSIIKRGLNYDPRYVFSTPDVIIIDLDSILSIMLTNELPDGEDRLLIVKNAVYALAEFINKWKNISTIQIIYSFKPTKKINEYIPEWCNERNARYNNVKDVNLILQEIVDRLKKITIENIIVKETDDSTILEIAKMLRVHPLKGASTTVISRDPHYLCLFRIAPGIEIYNGRHLINKNNYNKIKGYPPVSYVLLPYYYTLIGMSRNNYKGLDKCGPKKAYNMIYNSKYDNLNDDPLFKDRENVLKVMKLEIK